MAEENKNDLQYIPEIDEEVEQRMVSAIEKTIQNSGDLLENSVISIREAGSSFVVDRGDETLGLNDLLVRAHGGFSQNVGSESKERRKRDEEDDIDIYGREKPTARDLGYNHMEPEKDEDEIYNDEYINKDLYWEDKDRY